MDDKSKRSTRASNRAKLAFDKAEEQMKQIEAIQHYDQTKRELAEANATNQKLNSTVQKLEKLKEDTNGKTLREIEEHLLKTKREEIERQANTLFNQTVNNWKRTEKQKEVNQEAQNQITTEIYRIQYKKTSHTPVEGATTTPEGGDLHRFLTESINAEAQRLRDDEFKKSVEEKSKQIAAAKLEHLRKIEWEKWRKQNIDPKIQYLAQQIQTNLLSMLTQPANITCEKCGAEETLLPNEEIIAELLQTGFTRAHCINHGCNNLLTITLKKLIQSKMADNGLTPIHLGNQSNQLDLSAVF